MPYHFPFHVQLPEISLNENSEWLKQVRGVSLWSLGRNSLRGSSGESLGCHFSVVKGRPVCLSSRRQHGSHNPTLTDAPNSVILPQNCHINLQCRVNHETIKDWQLINCWLCHKVNPTVLSLTSYKLLLVQEISAPTGSRRCWAGRWDARVTAWGSRGVGGTEEGMEPTAPASPVASFMPSPPFHHEAHASMICSSNKAWTQGLYPTTG